MLTSSCKKTVFKMCLIYGFLQRPSALNNPQFKKTLRNNFLRIKYWIMIEARYYQKIARFFLFKTTLLESIKNWLLRVFSNFYFSLSKQAVLNLNWKVPVSIELKEGYTVQRKRKKRERQKKRKKKKTKRIPISDERSFFDMMKLFWEFWEYR